jgi:hypothetical protein
MRSKAKIWLYSISIIAILSIAICIPTIVTLAELSPASKAKAARKAVAASAVAAEAVAFADDRALYRYIDKQTDVICYFVLYSKAWATGGVACIPAHRLSDRGRDFVLNY